MRECRAQATVGDNVTVPFRLAIRRRLVEAILHSLRCPMKGFGPPLFLFSVWGYVVAPGVVLWVVAAYGAL